MTLLEKLDRILIRGGLYFPKITMIYYDRPIDRELLPGCRQIALKTLDSIETSS